MTKMTEKFASPSAGGTDPPHTGTIEAVVSERNGPESSGEHIIETKFGIEEENVDGATVHSSHSVPIDKEPEDATDYPDGGYGWVCVICAFMVNFATWGINTSFGIYLSFDSESNRFPGAKDIDFAFIGSSSLSSALAIAPFSNYSSKTFHWRYSSISGTICVVAGQISAGFSKEIWQSYLTQGMLFAIGLGLTMVVSSPIVCQWFGTKRAFAIGIVSAGSGGGALFFANITRITLERLGRQWACVVNGCISGACSIPGSLFYRTRATQLKVRFEPFQPSFYKNPGFIGMCLWGGFISFAYAIGIYTVPTFATQGSGLSQKDGSTSQSLLAVGQIVGRPSTGYVSDKVGRFNGAIVTTLVACISCSAIWSPAQNFATLAVAAIVQGASSGIFWSSSQASLTDLVGIRDMASALSMSWSSNVAPATVSAPIAIWLADYSRKRGKTGASVFHDGIIFAGVCYFASAVSSYGTKRYLQGNWKPFVKK